MAIIDDFKARFIDFDVPTADTYVPIYENVYACYFTGDYSDACNKEIILNLIAHMIIFETTFSGLSTSQNPIASKSVSDVSVSYSVPSQENIGYMDSFKLTKYGRNFLLLTSYLRQGALSV